MTPLLTRDPAQDPATPLSSGGFFRNKLANQRAGFLRDERDFTSEHERNGTSLFSYCQHKYKQSP